jgi:endonuclease YncB( thermonuclease family)
LALAPLASADTLVSRVVGVTDGDTITVLDDNRRQHKIRLAGIDAPEKGQPFGQRAKQQLSDLVYCKTVTVEWTKRDKYGRVVGKVLTPEGVDACLEQVKQGMAWHYKKYESEQSPEDKRAYAQAEQEARAGRRGLWRDFEPVPPWDWRAGRKAPASRQPPQGTVDRQRCDPAYPDVCIPSPPPDLDCGEVRFRRFRVLAPDPHRFDGDGVGCES